MTGAYTSPFIQNLGEYLGHVIVVERATAGQRVSTVLVTVLRQRHSRDDANESLTIPT